MKTLTIILTDGPYISEYADMACKIASEALKISQVNIFLYLDAVHIPKARSEALSLCRYGSAISGSGREGCCGQGLCQVRLCQRLSGR